MTQGVTRISKSSHEVAAEVSASDATEVGVLYVEIY